MKLILIRPRLLLVGIAAALVLIPAATSADAAGTLDQSQTDTAGGYVHVLGLMDIPGPGGYSALAQTFTAGVTGSLETVDLYLGNPGTIQGNLDVWIMQVSAHCLAWGNCPRLSEIVGVTSSAISANGSWVSVDFTHPVPLLAGQMYAIAMASDDADISLGYNWYQSTGDVYSGGSQYVCNASSFNCLNSLGSWQQPSAGNNDFAFKTYVAPPPPPETDLSVAITAPDSVSAGSTFSYAVTVKNAGPGAAQDVILTDPLPYGTRFLAVSTSTSASSAWSCTTPTATSGTVSCSTPSFDAGSSQTLSIKVRVTAGPDLGSLNDVATVTTSTDDPVSTNNGSFSSTSVSR